MTAFPSVLVIFGATGDLARRKLIPALYHLHRKKLLPPLFQIVAFSRRELTTEAFQEIAREAVKKIPESTPAETESFLRLFVYIQGFFDRKTGYKHLAEFLGFKDNEWQKCSNKLFYLAVPPTYYKKVFAQLAASRLTEPCPPEEGWTRVAVEKPFGKDLKTAEDLDKMLGRLFKEDQIYRIDHYLGKETIQNILAFRFSNSFLDPAWNNKSVQGIQVRFLEKLGLEGRGEFYDGVGALRDVGQNHLLQMLALITMRNPGVFDANAVRHARAEILKALRPLTKRNVNAQILKGQYQGFRAEKNISTNSRTETYFRIKTFIDLPEWSGVPILLEGGKAQDVNAVDISVVFRHKMPCLCVGKKHSQNILRYEVQPQERISTSFWVKQPGTEMQIEEKDFAFDYKQAFAGANIFDAYERLLIDAFAGNQTLFVSTEEIMASWKFVDSVETAWKNSELLAYKTGSAEARKAVFPEAEIGKTIGMVGLGKMGKNLALHLREQGWQVTGYDPAAKLPEIKMAKNLSELTRSLPQPRVIWLMLPAGAGTEAGKFKETPTDAVLKELIQFLAKGDIVIDGGNSFYETTVRRAALFKKHGINFLDVGVSGGPQGARAGASLMIGGDAKAFTAVEELFRDLAVPGGYVHLGKSGAGHFTKMVHNGIEYGMMQAIAEGFAIMKQSPFELDLRKVADIYNHGSVIESRLIGWLEKALREHGENLEKVSGTVGHLGEGEWTVKTAKKLKVPVSAIETAFKFRMQSKRNPSYIGKILSALRNQFGGHSVN